MARSFFVCLILPFAVGGFALGRAQAPREDREAPPRLRVAEVADVKTCGCPKSATCGDCCGPKHCPCNPSR